MQYAPTNPSTFLSQWSFLRTADLPSNLKTDKIVEVRRVPQEVVTNNKLSSL